MKERAMPDEKTNAITAEIFLQKQRTQAVTQHIDRSYAAVDTLCLSGLEIHVRYIHTLRRSQTSRLSSGSGTCIQQSAHFDFDGCRVKR
jgi:hypothetical protein